MRRAVAALMGALAVIALAGCAGVTPYAVAHHDEKMDYHLEEVVGLLTDQVFVSIAETENFSSVGYTHAVASSGETLNQQHQTSVMGGTWWSRETAGIEGSTIDSVHVAGSPTTYYLFGDAYLSVSGTPWVGFPEGDIGSDTYSVCSYPSVWYMCGIALAWGESYQTFEDDLPVLVEKNADGSMHLASAATLRTIVDVGLFGLSSELEANIDDETFDTLVPLHVWFDSNGRVTKAEINGSIGENPSLELQLGFEMQGEPTADDRPTDPAALDAQYVTMINEPGQIDAFWNAISAIRLDE